MAPRAAGTGGGRPGAEPTRDALLLALTFAAGAVDAFSYLALGRVFTANMTGNIVLLGIAAGQGGVLPALRSGLAFVGFAGGVLAGTILGGRARARDVWPPKITVVLGGELLLMLLLAAWWGAVGGRPGEGTEGAMIAVSALAMGVQTAAVRRLSVSGVTTTYVTGTLTSLMVQLTSLTGARGDWGRWGTVLAALLAGAAVGALFTLRWRPAAPALPAAVLLGVVAVAVIRFRAGERASGVPDGGRGG
jgi:uncharacterized membrane protein YoaK (UPF0700 family)